MNVMARLLREYVEQRHDGASGNQLQPLGNAFVRLVVGVSAMPAAVARLVHPPRQQPDLCRLVRGRR